jgi:hypothetical protein
MGKGFVEGPLPGLCIPISCSPYLLFLLLGSPYLLFFFSLLERSCLSWEMRQSQK